MPRTIDALAVRTGASAVNRIGEALSSVAKGNVYDVGANQALEQVVIFCMTQEMSEEEILDTVERAIEYGARRVSGR